jgi:glycosidase
MRIGYTQYAYTNLYSGFDFHYCDSRDRGIDDWNNKTQLQFCQLGGMADLKTESDYVRGTLVDHLNDLLSFPGVAGFRLDAAKHIPVADLQAIWGRLSRNPYVTSEVSLHF